MRIMLAAVDAAAAAGMQVVTNERAIASASSGLSSRQPAHRCPSTVRDFRLGRSGLIFFLNLGF